MKVFDCFTFNDELDLLELRLMELGEVVDQFVLVEAPMTFTLQAKPLHYAENASRFASWKDKIRHVVVSDIPAEPHPAAEHFQRRAILRGLGGVESTDTVLVGDVDEIPFRGTVETLRAYPPESAVMVPMWLYYYAVNLLKNVTWNATVIAKAGMVKDPEHLRQHRHFFPTFGKGSHFSWLGDAGAVTRKLDALDVTADAMIYGSSDIVKPDDPRTIRERVDNGIDLFGRGDMLQKIEVRPDEMHPHCIHEWLARHPGYFR